MPVLTGSDIPIVAAEDIGDFKCTGCGSCCQLWSVPIDPASFERAREFLEHPPEPRPNADRPWYVEHNGKKIYNLTDDGRCVFLQKDNHCFLHRFDPMLKSDICRQYPYVHHVTPRGLEISLTYSSYGAVLHSLLNGRPFQRLTSSMPRPASSSNDELTYDALAVRAPNPVNWDAAFAVEDALLAELERPGPVPSSVPSSVEGLDDALVRCARFLQSVEAEAAGPASESLRDRVMSGALRPVAAPPTPGVANLDAAYELLLKILSLRARILDQSPPLGRAAADVRNMRDEMGKARDESGTGAALFYRRLARDRYTPRRARLEPIMKKYLMNLIFQKQFFKQFGFVRGFNIICILYALMRVTIMLKLDPESERPADLFGPIHFVEQHFSHAGLFLEFWNEAFKSNMISSPNLAELLVRL